MPITLSWLVNVALWQSWRQDWQNVWKEVNENCSGTLDMGLCSSRPDCFPHWDGYLLQCRAAEAVNCSMSKRDEKKLLMFASLGLVNNALKRGFRELVLRLPDVSWSVTNPELGAAIKGHSQDQDDCKIDMSKAELSWRGLHEPNLYKGLKAVVLWDACFLKQSFWNAAHPDFGRYANYIKMTESLSGRHRQTLPRTAPNLARGDAAGVGSWSGLEEGYCEDFTPWLTEELGFDPDRVHRISLFDRLSSTNLTRMIFDIQKSREEAPNEALLARVQAEMRRVRAEIDAQLEDKQTEASRLMALLEQADVIALNGGNPDFLKHVDRASSNRRLGRMRFFPRVPTPSRAVPPAVAFRSHPRRVLRPYPVAFRSLPRCILRPTPVTSRAVHVRQVRAHGADGAVDGCVEDPRRAGAPRLSGAQRRVDGRWARYLPHERAEPVAARVPAARHGRAAPGPRARRRLHDPSALRLLRVGRRRRALDADGGAAWLRKRQRGARAERGGAAVHRGAVQDDRRNVDAGTLAAFEEAAPAAHAWLRKSAARRERASDVNACEFASGVRDGSG